MESSYLLMHKEQPYGVLTVKTDSGRMINAKIYDHGIAPFLGNADKRLIETWWDHRAVPEEREDIRRMIRREGYANTRDYMAKNLAISVSDTYWICPAELDLHWDDVKVSAGNIDKDSVTFHNANSYDPSATLGGQMTKYWDLATDPPTLVKKASAYYGQQNVNELFATELHRRLGSEIPFTEYSIEKAIEGGVNSRCTAYTSENAEYVPAYEILKSARRDNRQSKYDQFISVCAEHGLRADEVRRYLDYQTLTDFIITNTDRHLMNFGVIRDPDTLEFTAPAPIFDSGNSMFFTEFRKEPFTRNELMELRMSGIHKREAQMISHVVNRDIVDVSRLPDPEEVREFYLKYDIPEEKVDLIAAGYKLKLEMLRDFLNK